MLLDLNNDGDGKPVILGVVVNEDFEKEITALYLCEISGLVAVG